MEDKSTYTATLDRIEEGIAVLLLEDDSEVIDEKHIHDLERIPDEGRHEGAVLRVSIANDEIDTIEYYPEAEKERRNRLQDRFDQLSERPPGRDSNS